MLCPECEKRRIAEGHSTCYPCHIRGIGFSFHGGSTNWHGPTVRERENEIRHSTIRDNSHVERV